MRGIIAAVALVTLFNLTAAEAGDLGAIRERLLAMRTSASATSPESDASTCVLQSIACGQTINGSLDAGDCALSDGTVADFFQFNGTTGEHVTGTLTSAAFPPFLDLLDPTPTSRAVDGEATTAQVQFTLDVSGLWTLAVSNDSHTLQLGNYALTLACNNSSTGCNPDGNTLCLNNGRFEVQASFGSSGTAQVVKLTDDTGYLWFFSSSNVEAVIKILNGCGLGGHYWVFAGGLTNVNVTITVTDTQAHVSRTYTNPPNTTFLPIQDTSAFATCP
jgi:hypothetical protein